MASAREIAEDLRRRIQAGEWAPGERIPTHRQIQDTYGGSEPTIVRAVGFLIDEALVETDPHAPRTGAKVRERHPVRRDLVRGLHIEFQRAKDGETGPDGLFEVATGRECEQPSIYYEWIDAPTPVADALRIERDAPVLRRGYFWRIDGRLHRHSVSWMAAEVAQRCGITGLGAEVKGRGTMSQLADGGYPVDPVPALELEARMPTRDEVTLFALPPATPVIVYRRTLLSGGTPVEWSTATSPADQIIYTLSPDLTT